MTTKTLTKTKTKYMNMTFHNLKVAVRNLMKYKLQVTISVLSIAIGIVTLALVHAFVAYYKFPSICSLPYYERTYSISLESSEAEKSEAGSWDPAFTPDMIRALKRDGGLKTAERIAVPNSSRYGDIVEFQLCDSTKRKFYLLYTAIDPEYLTLTGLRSAITGQPVKKLRPGEAVISKVRASLLFGDANPVGAICFNINDRYPMPHTIVDVFENVSLMERCIDNYRIYFSCGEIEDALHLQNNMYYPARINVVLRQGCTEDQLMAELNERLKPFNYTLKMEKESDSIKSGLIANIQFFAHLAGSLILLAAIMGFLRMQMQLFWMRRREMSLRMVIGAGRGQLFWLLFSEVFFVVALSVAIAMMMGFWTEDFINTQFSDLIHKVDFCITMKGFVHYVLYIGGGLMLACSLVIWLTLMRICNARQGLAANMHRSRTHLFRNVMLGMQVIICIIFVCATLVIADWGDKMMERYHLSGDMKPYKESLLFEFSYSVTDNEALKNEIGHLPSLKEMVACPSWDAEIYDIEENEEAMAAFHGDMHQHFFFVPDTSLIACLQCKINWFDKPVDAGEYLILDEGIYKKLRELNLAGNNMLTVGDYGKHTLPIAGTIQNVPYEMRQTSFMIYPGVADQCRKFILIPKEGKYQSLVQEVDAVIQRMEPFIVEKIAQNFHESHADVMLVDTMRKVGWILATVSMVICAMSIYSTIALDTRSRRKEVAIRKINGAKSRDIYRLFGRLYFILVGIALVIALPVALEFREIFYDEFSNEGIVGIPFVGLFAAGSLIVIVLIAGIVGWNIHSIMRTNPSEIIVKE